MSKSTTIVTSTTALSSIAGKIRLEIESTGRAPSQQSLLNSFAHGIAGPKHDWGFMTGSKTPIIQKGLPQARLDDLQSLSVYAPPKRLPLLLPNQTKAHLKITPRYAPLFEGEMVRYLEGQITGDFIAIAEDFSTAGEHEADVQCMFEPTAIFAKDAGLVPRSLWGGTPEHVERTGRAYFAASSSANVNGCVMTAISEWPEDAGVETFKAFHLPRAVVVTTEYPFETLDDLGYHDADDEERSEIVNCAIQVFIDDTLSELEQAQVHRQVEDLLGRLAMFLRCDDPDLNNIVLA